MSPPPPPRLQLQGVTTPQLHDVDLSLAAGECAALTAESGTGKTRLLRAIADLDAHQGQVFLDGRPSSAWEAPAWRRAVGMLPAESQWWYDTVRPHLGGLEPAWLAALGLDEAMLDRPVARLSTGERQRLALLRLLGNRPAVLLLDEPTAALDDANSRRAEALIGDYRAAGGAAVLWVSHDPEQARRVAQRRLTISGGRLQEL